MKSKILLLKALIMLFAFSACGTKNSSQETPVYTIELEKLKNDINFYDIVKSYRLIALETKPENLIGEVDKILIHNNKIIIQSGGIYVFDMSGKHLYSIANFGRGPGEFIKIDNISIDGDFLYAYDNMLWKILSYDLSDGSYQADYPLPYSVKSVEVIDGNLVIYKPSIFKNDIMQGDDNIFISKLNDPKIILNQFLSNDEFNILNYGNFTGRNGAVYFRNSVRNDIYKIDANKATFYLHLDAKEKSPSEDDILTILNEKNTKNIKDKVYQIENFTETERHITMSFLHKENYSYMIFDKITKKSLFFNNATSREFEFLPISFITSDKNSFYRSISSNEIGLFKQLFKNEFEKNKNEYMKDPNYRIFDNVGEEDNPLIAVYELNPIE